MFASILDEVIYEFRKFLRDFYFQAGSENVCDAWYLHIWKCMTREKIFSFGLDYKTVALL